MREEPHEICHPIYCRYTPIHRACWGTEGRHTDTVRVFLEERLKHPKARVTFESLLVAAKNNPKTIEALRLWESMANEQGVDVRDRFHNAGNNQLHENWEDLTDFDEL